ncbi:uncharacterized protein LOC127149548 [Cucumis melo]|uniref:Uncharacterized protein LOC127149548 n=1 Tax=Cucumis melo TaxID=3656 RepID=A0ABM3KU28_CUCME|nr:uncharacterized protein LOC127149548 [Cucumis melo]
MSIGTRAQENQKKKRKEKRKKEKGKGRNPSYRSPPSSTRSAQAFFRQLSRLRCRCPARTIGSLAASSQELRSRRDKQAELPVRQPSLSQIESHRISSAETFVCSRRRAPLKPPVEAAVLVGPPANPSCRPSLEISASPPRKLDPVEPPLRDSIDPRPHAHSTCAKPSRARVVVEPLLSASHLSALCPSRSQPSSRAGSCFSSQANPPALEPSVCSGSFPSTLERLGPSDLGVLDFFSRGSSVATSIVDLRRLGKRVVTIRTRRANLQVEVEVGARASWRATRSDRGEP